AVSVPQDASVERLEQLLIAQQSLQQQQAQQLSRLHQQLQTHSESAKEQDWQWIALFSAALVGLGCVGCVTALWQRRPVSAPKQSFRRPWSGFLRLSKRHETVAQEAALPASTAPISQRTSTDLDWLMDSIRPDELDSQLLAEEGLREFELRRTVGLQRQALTEPLAVSPPKPGFAQQQQDLDEAWAGMQEVMLEESLDDEAPAIRASEAVARHRAPMPVSAEVAVAVNVSNEVQKVRKLLQQRRQERLQSIRAAHCLDSTSTDVADADKFQADEALSEEMTPEVVEEVVEEVANVMTERAALDPVHSPASSLFVQSGNALACADSSALIFPASQRGMSEMEVRLALAQEFRRMGQIEEAEILCQEALHLGNNAEQRSARQLLESLPGR
ncbi:MAG: hypothetical protein HC858_08810, partial [Brachymonas sp.]|nr:hypothetical protein [Brachymonas sp.]